MVEEKISFFNFLETPYEVVKENWILAYYFDEEKSVYYEIHFVKNEHYCDGLLIDDVWGMTCCSSSAQRKIDIYFLADGLEKQENFTLNEKYCFFLKTKKIEKVFYAWNDIDCAIQKDITSRIYGLISKFKFERSSKPLLTVITTVYNNALLLEQTIQSVINQNCGEFEYIIKDAVSTDSFEDVVKKYSNIRVVRCKDRGIYDGMDQGIKVACGEYVEILNSDDLFSDSNVIARYVAAIKNEKADAFCSDIDMHFPNGCSLVRKADLSKLRYRSCVNHTSLVLKRKDYFELGGFDKSLKIAADCDLTIKMVKAKLFIKRLNFICVKFRAEGASNSTYTFRTLKENLTCRLRFSKFNMLGCCYTILQYLKIKIFK